ncbi:hypothetical protein C0J52_20975 [Blattella germanica]|nr:hypothetical protein C0J52_20975 [Blattella germanica]
MLSYEALLLTLVLGLVTISHQYEVSVETIRDEHSECPEIENGVTYRTQCSNKCDQKSGTSEARGKCPSPDTICPSKKALLALGYEKLGDFGYYKMIKGRAKKYDEAKQLCEDEGSHLVVVNSDEEAKALNAYIDRVGIRGWYWAGFDDKEEEGVYKTIYNKTIQETGFSTVYPNEFRGKRNENCGIYLHFGNNYGLGDYNCNSTIWQICERDDV